MHNLHKMNRLRNRRFLVAITVTLSLLAMSYPHSRRSEASGGTFTPATARISSLAGRQARTIERRGISGDVIAGIKVAAEDVSAP